MPFIGNQPAKVPLTSADITDGIITNADIANSTINLTTKVTGSLPVANGGTGLTALGTASQVLKVNSGATALEFGTLSSDFVRLSTSTITANTASVSFDGFFTSDYDTYIIYGNNILLDTVAGSNFLVRYRVSNSDVTTNDYFMVQYAIESASAANVSVQHPATSFRMNYNNFTSSSNHTAHFVITLSDPNNNQGAKYKQMHFNLMYVNGSGYTENVHGSAVNTNATTALSGLKFFPTNGNFDSGSIVLYGVKK